MVLLFTYRKLMSTTKNFRLSTKQQPVTCHLGAACLFKHIQQIGYLQMLLFFSLNVDNYPAVMQHNQAIAVTQSVAHIMGNHQRCQLITGYDFSVSASTFAAVFGSSAAVCSSKSSSFGFFSVAISKVSA